MACNSDTRKAINYTSKEPIDKYDLWLSENLRYNLNNQLIYDVPGLPGCDLILKAYVNGLWRTVVGSNTTANNKINIVKNVQYPETGTTGYTLNHLPLFRSPDDSPNELFDAGTLGLAINTYVTSSEWQLILNNSNFYNAWNTAISHMNILRAQLSRLGGIWANYFSTTSAASEYVEPKFKTSSAGTDDKLYVYAGDIVNSISNYLNNNNNEHLPILLANTEYIGGIKAATDPDANDDMRNIPIVLGGPAVGCVWGFTDFYGYPLNKYPGDLDTESEYLYLPGYALMKWLENPFLNGSSTSLGLPINGWNGVDTQLRSGYNGVWIGLSGYQNATNGQVLSKSQDGIEWIDALTYPVLSQNSSSDISYVINGGGTKGTYLNNEGEWTVPVGTTYTSGIGIDITSSVISLNIPTVTQSTDETVKSISGITISDSATGIVTVTEIDADSINDIETDVPLCNYCEITPAYTTTDVIIRLSYKHNLPVYIIYNNTSTNSVTLDGDFKYIGSTTLSASSTYLLTIQFGIVRIEQVSTNTESNSLENV